MSNTFDYHYDFSLDEVKQLVLFMRAHEEELPLEIDSFFSKLERVIYDNMTIEEVENFFDTTKNT